MLTCLKIKNKAYLCRSKHKIKVDMNANLKQFAILIFTVSTIFLACNKDPEVISGCTDPLGDNFNAQAAVDNSTCTYQKRFLGEYNGEFKCKGSFAAVFTMAQLKVTELIKKDEVNIIIESTIGPLPVMGKLTKDTMSVDATLTNLKVKVGDVVPGGGDAQVLVEGKVKTKLKISTDNKILTGVITLELTTKEPTTLGGFITIPAGYKLTDDCDFKGTKK
jgi:hypothetical protein